MRVCLIWAALLHLATLPLHAQASHQPEIETKQEAPQEATRATRREAPAPGFITRLDGTKLSFAEADSFARNTLHAAHVTGAQIAILEHGKLVWSAAFGRRRLDPPLPMERETTTWAASITKSVFATYFMSLAERGTFKLDTPLQAQLPRPLDQYEEYRDTAVELVKDPSWARVTPRMLLSHSSGLQNFPSQEPDKRLHLHFTPGTRFLYSGTGINLVQLLVEQKLGKPLDVLIEEAIFAPLGMRRSGLIFRQEFAANVSDRFDAEGSSHAKTQRFPARAAGSMTTSADDLARFLTALFAGKVIQPQTFKQMLTPVLDIRTLHQFPQSPEEMKPNPAVSGEAEQAGHAYGIGWGLLTRTRYGPAFFKEGHGDGAENYLVCFTRSQFCMIALTNSDNGELAFCSLFEHLAGDTVTPWEWEGYTPGAINAARNHP